MYHAIKNGESMLKEDVCIKRLDGSIVNFRGMAVPLKDVTGKIIYGVGVLEDITKEKRVEKMRTDFLSLASHQLRTPLSGTKWLVETLKMEKFGTLNPKQRQYLDELEHVNERMIRLVFDMLNALRFESGSMEIKKGEASVGDVFGSVVDLLDSAAKKRGVSIQGLPKEAVDIIIESDISLIKTALETLVSNAIEYSSSGQAVILDAQKKEGDVIFSVKDFGIGIPEGEKEKITERFYRAGNAKAARPDGTGLGLYISTMLVEKVGGEITFESKENEGSTFYLRIPERIKNS
jgi:signal transduction histidine kinase